MIAVLFVNRRSHYKSIPDLDCYDVDRDARTYHGNDPIIAHPPCAQWGRLRKLAKYNPTEKLLGVWAVNMVRRNGGIVEHPSSSKLFEYCGLPMPGKGADEFGGYTLDVDQSWWSYPAAKRTWLYVVGVPIADLPPYPMRLDAITHAVDTSKRGNKRILKYLSKSRRAETVEPLCKWLIKIAGTARRWT